MDNINFFRFGKSDFSLDFALKKYDISKKQGKTSANIWKFHILAEVLG